MSSKIEKEMQLNKELERLKKLGYECYILPSFSNDENEIATGYFKSKKNNTIKISYPTVIFNHYLYSVEIYPCSDYGNGIFFLTDKQMLSEKEIEQFENECLEIIKDNNIKTYTSFEEWKERFWGSSKLSQIL